MLTDAWYAQPSEPLQGSRQHSDADAVSHAERQQAGLHSHLCACLCRSVNAAQHGALHEYSQQHDVCNKSLQQQAGGRTHEHRREGIDRQASKQCKGMQQHLQIHLGVPVTVIQDDNVCSVQVDAQAASTRGQ